MLTLALRIPRNGAAFEPTGSFDVDVLPPPPAELPPPPLKLPPELPAASDDVRNVKIVFGCSVFRQV